MLHPNFEKNRERGDKKKVEEMLESWMEEEHLKFEANAYDSISDFIVHIQRVRPDMFIKKPQEVVRLLKDVLLHDKYLQKDGAVDARAEIDTQQDAA